MIKRSALTAAVMLAASVMFGAHLAAAQPKPRFQKPRPRAARGGAIALRPADRALTGGKGADSPRPAPAGSAVADSMRRETQALSQRVDQLERALADQRHRTDSIGAAPQIPETTAQSLRHSLTGIDGRLGQSEAALKEIAAVKLSGYIQFRYSYDDLGSVTDGAAATNMLGTVNTTVNGGQGRSLFYIQRGRVRLTCKPAEATECVIEIDASKTGVGVIAANIKITEPWTGRKMSLTAGQMAWPFGIDIERSNVIRELPEYARVTKALFPGYMDRGIKVTVSPIKNLVSDVGVFNGWGTTNKYFPWDDPTRQKDVLARVRYTAWGTTVALSYFDGQSYVPKVTTFTVDNAGNLSSSSQKGTRYYKGRVGLGLESHIRLLKAGETVVLLEAVDGHEAGNRVGGGYALLSQPIVKNVSIAYRIDTYDRDRRHPYRQDWTSGIGLNYQWDKAVRLSAAYEVNRTNMDDRMRHADPSMATADPADNRFTAQVQIKF